METTSRNITIAVAVSGGADSLYTLLHLQEKGHSVIALHGIFLSEGMYGADAEASEKATVEAAMMRDRLDAMCREIGIPLCIRDYSREFCDLVVRPFVSNYAAGTTPNPCALCNANIKFGLLLATASELGASMLATGHYATLLPLQNSDAGSNSPSIALMQGADPNKDQSYFLSLVPVTALEHALFPLGEITKKEVLASLSQRGITPAQPGESQEVCFIPQDRYREFLPRMAEKFGMELPGPGPMLLHNGQRVGTHKGLWQYTEGQRKGLGIGWKEPLHVLAKEVDQNILRLGSKNEMRAEGCVCGSINILLSPEEWPDTVLVKTRYRERPKPATVKFIPDPQLPVEGPEGNSDEKPECKMHIRFLDKDTSVACGQVAAVYIPCIQEDSATKETLRLVAGAIIEGTF